MSNLRIVSMNHEPKIGAVISVMENVTVRVVRILPDAETAVSPNLFFGLIRRTLPPGAIVYFVECEKLPDDPEEERRKNLQLIIGGEPRVRAQLEEDWDLDDTVIG